MDAALQIGPSGAIMGVRVRSESVRGQGFGAVCRRCLSNVPAWTPPLDRQGTPVATTFPAFCEFNVNY